MRPLLSQASMPRGGHPAKWQLAKAASGVYQARQAAQAWCGCVALSGFKCNAEGRYGCG
jgi:hypothetical protein